MSGLLEKLKGLRTAVVMGATFLFSILATLGVVDLPKPEDIGLSYDQLVGGVAAAISLIALILRLFTTSPLGKKA